MAVQEAVPVQRVRLGRVWMVVLIVRMAVVMGMTMVVMMVRVTVVVHGLFAQFRHFERRGRLLHLRTPGEQRERPRPLSRVSGARRRSQ